MKFKFIRSAGYAVCACFVIISALAFTGCSRLENEQRYESPADDPTIESNEGGMVSSEDSTASSEDSTVSDKESAANSGAESQTITAREIGLFEVL